MSVISENMPLAINYILKEVRGLFVGFFFSIYAYPPTDMQIFGLCCHMTKQCCTHAVNFVFRPFPPPVFDCLQQYICSTPHIIVSLQKYGCQFVPVFHSLM